MQDLSIYNSTAHLMFLLEGEEKLILMVRVVLEYEFNDKLGRFNF